MMQKTVFNAETGEVSVVAMSDAEIAGIMARPQAQLAKPLSREAFCVALIGAGIFTVAEATEAALGAWPPKFEPALAGKPLVEQLQIKILWQGTKTVARDAALFLDLLAFYAAAKGLTEAQAAALGDAIFAEAV